MRKAGALLIVVQLTGCLSKKLKTPAQDHHVQTMVIAERCRSSDGYPESPCSKELQEDLDAMTKQAEAIHAISEGKDPK